MAWKGEGAEMYEEGNYDKMVLLFSPYEADQAIYLKEGTLCKISIFYGESENSTLHAIWTLIMVEISIFPSSSRVTYSIRGS